MKKLSTKALLIGLVILIVIFLASRYFRAPGLESNIRRDLLAVDTASVTEVTIRSAKDQAEEIRLVRSGKLWSVRKGERTEPANPSSVRGLLGTTARLEAQRLVSRKKDRWDEFQVGETGTHVRIQAGDKKVGDFHVGKLGLVQGGGGMYGGSYTYVRISDEDEVYSVEGFLEPTFNTPFNDWRDKTLLKLKNEDLVKLTFRYPADSGFVLSKHDSLWYIGNDRAEVSRVEAALRIFASKYLTDFKDDFKPSSAPTAVVQVDGISGTLATIEAWKVEQDWILTSSFQKGIYFSAKPAAVSDILIGKKKLAGQK